MRFSLKPSMLNYLQTLDSSVNRWRIEAEQKGLWPKWSKSLLAIEILLLSSTPLLFDSLAVAVAAPQKIAQNPGDGIQRPTLRVGSQGERVSELQAALKLLGFYSGAVDGVYSENTASAVSRFKQAAGLNPDGIVDASTWQRLFPNQSIVTPTVPSSQPTSNSTTNFPVPTLASNVNRPVSSNPTAPKPPKTQAANSNPARKPPKTQVANSNPEPRPATPRQSTTSRVQKTPNRTSAATTRSQPTARTQQIPGVQYTSEGLPILRVGMRNSEVNKLQERLKRLGFLNGGIDGDFGATTEAAVKALQKRYGLEPDGVVGGSTWEVLLRR